MTKRGILQNSIEFNRKNIERIKSIKDSMPLFIVGCPRSGTTLVLRLIRDYLDMAFGRDDGRFLHFRNRLANYGNLAHDRNLSRLITDIFADDDFRRRFRGLSLDPDAMAALMEKRTYPEVVRHICAALALMQGKSRWGDKTPQYVFHMGDLLDMFPDAKFIHVIRDGRDVALSLFRMPWGAPRNCFVAAKYWNERVNAAQAFGRTLGAEKYLEIRYERLLMDPLASFQRILDFGRFAVDQAQVIRQFGEDVDTVLKRGNFGKWQTDLSASEIRIFEQVSGAKLRALGYEVWNPGQIDNPIRLDRKMCYHLHNLLCRAIIESTAGIPAKLRHRVRQVCTRSRLSLFST